MWYLIVYSSTASSKDEWEKSIELRNQVRQAHLQRCEKLEAENRLLLGGPFPRIDSPDPSTWEESGFSGGMLIAHFSSLQDAEKWANDDPYVKSGAFGGKVMVKPWHQTIGKRVASLK